MGSPSPQYHYPHRQLDNSYPPSMGLLPLYNYRPHYLRDIVNRQLTSIYNLSAQAVSPMLAGKTNQIY
jgi:hypothetical protein